MGRRLGALFCVLVDNCIYSSDDRYSNLKHMVLGIGNWRELGKGERRERACIRSSGLPFFLCLFPNFTLFPNFILF